MVTASIPVVQTDDRNINQIQSNIVNKLNTLLKNPILSGQYITDQALVSGDNIIQQSVGQKLTGYLVILKSANVDIYDKQSTNTEPETTLILNSSGAATVSLYVF